MMHPDEFRRRYSQGGRFDMISSRVPCVGSDEIEIRDNKTGRSLINRISWAEDVHHTVSHMIERLLEKSGSPTNYYPEPSYMSAERHVGEIPARLEKPLTKKKSTNKLLLLT